jgi:hypothetical protein
MIPMAKVGFVINGAGSVLTGMVRKIPGHYRHVRSDNEAG